jgi:Protein of unknown function (DUF1579)
VDQEHEDQVVETCGERTAAHERLDGLVGVWDVEKLNYLVGPAPGQPARSAGMTAHNRRMPGGGRRFLEDRTSGEFGGEPYFRHGVLGYSIIDDRYEWNTVDGANPHMMTYKGRRGSGADAVISMDGDFTDGFGLFGPQSKGETIIQRTTVTIESPDRHVIDIYFTRDGSAEVLADHGVYTRKP